MELKDILRELERLTSLVKSWEQESEIPVIERDMVLEKMRSLYEQIRYFELHSDEQKSPLEETSRVGVAVASQEPLTEESERQEFEALSGQEQELQNMEEMHGREMEEDMMEILEFEDDLSLDFEPFDDEDKADLYNEEPLEENREFDKEPSEQVVYEESESGEVDFISDPDPDSDPEPELQPEVEESPISEPISEPESEVEIAPTPEPIAEPLPEPTSEPEVEVTPAPEPRRVQNSLFGEEEMPYIRKSSRRALMSLYGESSKEHKSMFEERAIVEREQKVVEVLKESEPQKMVESVVEEPISEVKTQPQEPISEPLAESSQKEAAPISQPTTVLGDILHSEHTIVAESIAPKPDLASTLLEGSLGENISLNDRFLMIRELFGGDRERYDVAISEFDKMESYDDALIYIAENYMWNPNADATKLLLGLLERKFGEA
ncbi:MAG: hypothetical protein UHY58_06810 [Alistipes sp.]|nr:hypothetical protein [Alistipes sp.]